MSCSRHVTIRKPSSCSIWLDSAGAYTIVGQHYGKSRIDKVRGLIVRSNSSSTHQRGGKHISLAVSHGSRSMVLAARWLKIPVLTMYDYEFTETGIFNRFSTRVLVPDTIPDDVLDEIGISRRKCGSIRAQGGGLRPQLPSGSRISERDFLQSMAMPTTRLKSSRCSAPGDDRKLSRGQG